jgi:ubiquinone/menaquinone biosynthesis C-methylase UbiE
MANLSNEKSGIHNVLRLTFVYDFVQYLLGSGRGRDVFIKDYIKPSKGDRILDFGCGTGTLFSDLNFIEEIEYFGIDPNEQYIDHCHKNFSSNRNAHFFVGSLEIIDSISEHFDTIVLSAVLHHLSVDAWPKIIEKLFLKLSPGGRIVLLDIVKHPNQHLISKFLVSADRGVSVLHINDYLKKISGNYSVNYDLRTDLMRVPYSHIISIIS